MQFVSREGTAAVEFNSRSGTPILPMTNLVNGNVIQVVANVNISNGGANGLYYNVQATNDSNVEALTGTSVVVQNITGWTSTTCIAFFKVKGLTRDDPTTEIDFEVNFLEKDLGGDGQRYNNFVLTGRVVDTEDN